MRNWIWIISFFLLFYSNLLFAAEQAIVLENHIGVISAINVEEANGETKTIKSNETSQSTPINKVGIAFIFLGMTLMIVEVFIGSFGLIGTSGLIVFIVGTMLLLDVSHPTYRIALSLIFSFAVIALGFFFILSNLLFKSHKKEIVSGQEGLIGQVGFVIIASKEQLRVQVLGEIWNAKSKEVLNVGQKIKVTHVHGLELTVVPVEPRSN